MKEKPLLLKEANFPAFGKCRPDKASASLGEKWFRFARSDGIKGLGKAQRNRAEVLAVEASGPTNFMVDLWIDTFIDDLKRMYPRVFFWLVQDKALADYLESKGFMFCIDRQDGEDVPGYVWDKDGLDVSSGKYCARLGDLWASGRENPFGFAKSFIDMGVFDQDTIGLFKPTNIDGGKWWDRYEIATIGKTIIFKRYGRTQDQAGTVGQG